MGNFKDFDLDLKKVSINKNDNDEVASVTITFSVMGKCNSVENPTTGMTAACCRNSRRVCVNEGNAQMCI